MSKCEPNERRLSIAETSRTSFTSASPSFVLPSSASPLTSPAVAVSGASSSSASVAAAVENDGGSKNSMTSGQHHRLGRILCDGHLRLVEVLRVTIAQLRNLPTRSLPSSSSSSSSSRNHVHNTSSEARRPITILARLDSANVYQCSSLANGSECCFGGDFMHEVSNTFSQLHFTITENVGSRIPRPIGRVSIRKRDIVKHSGEDRWYRIQTIDRQNDVSGQICLDVRYESIRRCIALK